MKQRIGQIVALVALSGLMAACGGGGGGGGSPSGVASIVVSPASASIAVGATQQFTAVAKDASGYTLSGVSFTWQSSSPGVASINSSGLATGIAAGTTQITAKAGSVVSNPAALSVTSSGGGGGGGGGNGSFSLSLTPGAPSAGQGGSATVAVGVSRNTGTVGNVNLTLLGSAVSSTPDPAKVSYSFSPNPETGSGSTLTLNVGANVPPGVYALTVQGQSSSDTETAPLSLTVTAPHTVLLVDDDGSANNSSSGSTDLSVSDSLFRNLLTAAGVGYDVFVVPTHGNGPTFDQMKGYARVVWYTGNDYSGSTSGGTLSSVDELSLKAYLDQGNRELLLFSTEYPFDIQAGWTSTNSDAFFANYLGAVGGEENPNSHSAGGGLNHRSFPVAGVAGTVTAGDAYTVQKDIPLKTYTSAINPASGTDTLLTTPADPTNSGTDSPVAVATGRKGVGTAGSSKVVYVGITLENLFETGSTNVNKAQLLNQLLGY